RLDVVAKLTPRTARDLRVRRTPFEARALLGAQQILSDGRAEILEHAARTQHRSVVGRRWRLVAHLRSQTSPRGGRDGADRLELFEHRGARDVLRITLGETFEAAFACELEQTALGLRLGANRVVHTTHL